LFEIEDPHLLLQTYARYLIFKEQVFTAKKMSASNYRFQADIQYSLFAITVKEIFQKFSKNSFFLANPCPFWPVE